MKYYINDDYGHLVRLTDICTIETLRVSESEWVELPPDSSYMREIFLGQGNNCLTPITLEKAAQIMEERLGYQNVIHGTD